MLLLKNMTNTTLRKSVLCAFQAMQFKCQITDALFYNVFIATVALRGQMCCNLRKHQQVEKLYKNSQMTRKVKKKQKKTPEKNKCFWGDSNVTKQLLMK